MLKLEKTSQDSSLAVKLREKDRFLEPRLLKALALALLLHAAGLLVFHISPFSLTSTFVFPPVELQSDFSTKSLTAVGYTIQQELIDELSPPPVSLISPLQLETHPEVSALAPKISLHPQAFTKLEERVWPIWEPPLTLQLEEPRILMQVSGNLAEHSLLAFDPALSQMHPFSTSIKPFFADYRVQIHEATGEIFWYERMDASGSKAVDQLTEKILQTLRFSVDGTLDSVTGSIHFAVKEPIEAD